MRILEKLNSIRAQQRGNFSFLESLEDYDLVCGIGAAQEAGGFATAKELLLNDLGAPATLRRRLDRLVKLGVVVKQQNNQDGRVAELRLSKEVVKDFTKLGKYIEKL